MKGYTININDIFFGSQQSKYAGVALFMTIAILCLSILFSSSKIPLGERFMFVLFILIITVPSILMSLFELTCITTGGNYNYRWWCWALAWVLSVIIILYCVLIIISMFISMSSYDMANHRLDVRHEEDKIDSVDANNYAKKIMMDQQHTEKLTQTPQRPPQQAPQQPPQQPPQQAPQQAPQQPPQQAQYIYNESVPNMNVQQRPMATSQGSMMSQASHGGLSSFDAGDNYASVSSMPMTMSQQSNNFNLEGFNNGPSEGPSVTINTKGGNGSFFKNSEPFKNGPVKSQQRGMGVAGFDNSEAQYQSF
jgi:hypothetical protein